MILSQIPDIDKLSSQQLEKMHKRNKFHVHEYNKWFRQRQKNVSPNYLYYPEERQLQMEIKQIFRVFDVNNSQTIDLAEMFLMFKHFGFQVSQNDLKIIFSIVDDTKDQALNYKEFKALTENNKALKQFRIMMKKIQGIMRQSKDQKYVPLSMGAMLTYLAYMLKRENYIHAIMENDQLSVQQKYHAYQELINIKEQKSLVDEAYELYMKAQERLVLATSRRNSLSKFDELDTPPNELRQNYRRSFSTLNGLQPILFRNMSLQEIEKLKRMTQIINVQTQLQIQEIDSFSQTDTEESFSKEMDDLIQKAEQVGRQQAYQIHGKPIRQQKTTPQQISAQRIQVKLPRLKGITNRKLLKRPIKITSPPLVDRSVQHLTTLGSGGDMSYSTEIGTWTNRVLRVKLPQVL
ncbi:hypothetical protein pb186bvf_013640 [Paramecium bursaria]